MTKETAMKILKELHGKSLFAERTALETLIPELADSNDERIRKELIRETKGSEERLFEVVTNEEFIAWLEKQGECKDTFPIPTRETILSIWELGNDWKDITHGSISTKYGTQLEYIQKHWQESEYYLEKQGEQKPILDFKANNWHVSKVDGKIHDMTYNPTDRAEPKFNVDDYIVSDYCMGRVVEITNDAYLLDIGQGIPFSCEDNMHLWTIADAKEGDILAGKIDGDCYILIFKTIKDGWIETYGHYYNAVDRFCVPSQLFCRSYQGTFTPATKEQRDTLMKAMADAGYEFDFEKKELKKIEQNTTDTAKSKFKVGNYIIHNELDIICKIISVNSGSYYVENIETSCRIKLSYAEQNFHLWTIQDAKDGDVLHSPEHNLLWIYKNKEECHAAINLNYVNSISFGSDIVIPSDVCPANRVQKSILFQKMSEAGYKWDTEKKELKKLTQSVTKKSDKVWSEEDENMANDLIEGFLSSEKIHHLAHSSKEIADWLKSLKDRIGG